MPRNENEGPGDGLMAVGEDLGINEAKLGSFDDITKTLEHLLGAVLSGKATRYQIEAADRIIDKAGRTLQAKATFQKQLDAIKEQGMIPVIGEDGRLVGARREGDPGIAMPTLLQGGKTGTPFRTKTG